MKAGQPTQRGGLEGKRSAAEGGANSTLGGAHRTAEPLGARTDLEDVDPYLAPQIHARVRLNTNESPYPPPPELVHEITEGLARATLNRYPDRDASSLVDALVDQTGWPRAGLWVANGSNEIFLHLLLAFGGPGRRSLTFEPTYALHTLIPKIAGTKTLQVPLTPGFKIDVEAALATIRSERPEVIIVCSPNNPTGACVRLRTIRALCESADGIVVVDEAYIEFAEPEDSARDLLEDYPNLIITRTFSKAWQLAGVRIGFMMAAPDLVGHLAKVRLPYHLSTITQIAGEAALRHSHSSAALVKAIVDERNRIGVELQKMGLKTWPSRANFILFEVDDPDHVWEQLLERGVLIRKYSDIAGLERCLRVTAGLPEETDAFVEAIRGVLDE